MINGSTNFDTAVVALILNVCKMVIWALLCYRFLVVDVSLDTIKNIRVIPEGEHEKIMLIDGARASSNNSRNPEQNPPDPGSDEEEPASIQAATGYTNISEPNYGVPIGPRQKAWNIVLVNLIAYVVLALWMVYAQSKTTDITGVELPQEVICK